MDRSVMFKSKSGNHLSKAIQKDDDRYRNRRDKRQTAYLQNRIIEATPAKPLKHDSPTNESIHDNIKTEKENSSSIQSNLSRQKAFRDRFKNYMAQKAVEKQAKSTTKPFLSAVAKGRFVDASNGKKIDNKKTKLVKPTTVEMPKYLPSKFSPINTRSKKRALLSPSQLPTARRKSKSKNTPLKSEFIKKNSGPSKQLNRIQIRKNVVKATTASTVAKPKPKLILKPNPVKRLAQKETGLIRNDLIAKGNTKSNELKPNTQWKPNGLNANKIKFNGQKLILPSKPHGQYSKEANNDSVSVLSEQCVFAPNFIQRVTSTVVRPKKSITIKSTSLFDESFSPIEEIPNENRARTPAKVEMKSAIEILGTPTQNSEVHGASFLNYVSPYVTISRGSRLSIHKEKEARNKKYSLESRKSLNDSIENRQKKEAASYFHLQAQREIDRFNVLIEKWKKKVENDESIPSEYQDLINAAIGQTNLLITSKIKQFTGLIEKCDSCNDDQKITPEDLEGFWSMVYLQVEHCNARFQRLDVLSDNDWVDPELDNVKEKKIQTKNAMVKKTKQPKKQVNSALASMLKEARKKMKEKELLRGNDDTMASSIVRSSAFASHTPRKTITPRKNNWIIQDSDSVHPKTPMRSILKTPGSVRKTPGSILKFKSSPQVRIIEDSC